MTQAEIDAGSLRRQMRAWRRQRADTTLHEQLSEAYIWVFAIVVIGAMSISAMVQTRLSIASGCTTATCEDARTSLVWAVAGAALAVTLGAAAAIGPVMVTPASAAWLLSTPVDRRPLLRSRLLLAGGLSAVLCGVVVVAAGLLSGLNYRAVAVLGAAAAACGAAAAGSAAIGQSRRGRAAGRAAAMLAVATCGWVLLMTIGVAPATDDSWLSGPAGWALLAVATASAVLLLTASVAGLPRLSRAQLVPGGSLLSSLSGALAGLDPTLVYDVLLARRWAAAATVRPVRGGPSGAWALVWRDLVRLRRSTGAVVALTASLLVPYVCTTLGLDDVTILAAALVAFVTGVWLCSALRTTARGSDLMRCFPMPVSVLRLTTLAVPAGVLTVWALAAAPAMAHTVDASAGVTVLVAVATATAVLGAICRWLLAGPPDYSRPLVSSPAGAIPTGLIGSTLRGFDVLALLTVPLLVAPDVIGSLVSLALSAAVMSYLVTRP